MEFPKDRCAFCEHTTRHAPKVSRELLNSFTINAPFLNIDILLSEELDAFLPIPNIAPASFFAGRRGKYCGIFDSFGRNLLGLNFLVLTPPILTSRLIFVLQNKDYEWGAMNLEDPYNPQIVVPFGTYKYMWGYDSEHALVSSKGIGTPGTFEGRGIIDSNGEIVVGFKEYRDIWNFYNDARSTIKVETFDGRILYIFKNQPIYESIVEKDFRQHANYDEEPFYGSRYGEYSGTYAQDVAGLSDDVIDDAFEGDPEAYWNID